MAVRIGHASISENGNINGSKGDQTAKEVCEREWYDKGWDYAAIHPDAQVREKHAKAVEAGCANNNIGYGQGDRNTLNTEAKKVNYDLSKIKTKCNTDCSEFMNVCAVASGAPGVTHAANGWTTSTMKKALQNAGYRIITDKMYLRSAEYCVRGMIYVKSGSHTVCGLSNGSKYVKTLSVAGVSAGGSTSGGSSKSSGPSTSTSSSGTPLNRSVKRNGKATAVLDVRTWAGTENGKCSFSPIQKGEEVGICDELKAKDGSKWYYIKNKAGKYGFVHSSYIDDGAAAVPAKTVDQIAREVIAGKWGNGAERKKRLEAAGYNYTEVQKKVNELI